MLISHARRDFGNAWQASLSGFRFSALLAVSGRFPPLQQPVAVS